VRGVVVRFIDIGGIRPGRDCMVVEFTISAYHHLSCEFKSLSWWGVLDTTLCDKVCQCVATGRWFSPGTPVSSINKTDRHNITEILLKVALSIISLIPFPDCMLFRSTGQTAIARYCHPSAIVSALKIKYQKSYPIWTKTVFCLKSFKRPWQNNKYGCHYYK
jgi:hypothetical protein